MHTCNRCGFSQKPLQPVLTNLLITVYEDSRSCFLNLHSTSNCLDYFVSDIHVNAHRIYQSFFLNHFLKELTILFENSLIIFLKLKYLSHMYHDFIKRYKQNIYFIKLQLELTLDAKLPYHKRFSYLFTNMTKFLNAK